LGVFFLDFFGLFAADPFFEIVIELD